MRNLAIMLACFIMTVVGLCGAPTVRADTAVQPPGTAAIPEGPAPNWIIADLDSGQILAERNGYALHPPASTIKVLLALVALEEVDLNATVVASDADTDVECNCAGIVAGRTYTARQLLDGVLLASGNDAANTLAELLGGGHAAVAKMNAKATTIGATRTHAATPSGLDGPGGSGVTSPHDLAVIFRAAMANPVFAQIVAQPSAPFPGARGQTVLVTGNELLGRYPGALGGKTGFTNAAKKTYVGAAARNGRRLVIAMMYGLVTEGGPTYWDQAATLLDWGFAQQPQAAVGAL